MSNRMKFVLPQGKSLAIVSDVHLGSNVEDIAPLLEILTNYDYIVFNGDIFDLWLHRWEKIIKGKGEWLYTWMQENPKKFFYVAGNHDEDIKKVASGFPVFDELVVISGKHSCLIKHGHQFDNINRNPPWWVRPIVWIEYAINTVFRTNIQSNIQKRKTTFSALPKELHDNALKEIRKQATAEWIKRKFTYLIHGHTHTPEISGFVIDQGSFVVGVSYVEIRNSQASLRVLEKI